MPDRAQYTQGDAGVRVSSVDQYAASSRSPDRNFWQASGWIGGWTVYRPTYGFARPAVRDVSIGDASRLRDELDASSHKVEGGAERPIPNIEELIDREPSAEILSKAADGDP